MSTISIFEIEKYEVELSNRIMAEETRSALWIEVYLKRPYDPRDLSDRAHQDSFFYENELDVVKSLGLENGWMMYPHTQTHSDFLFTQYEVNELSYEEVFNMIFYKKTQDIDIITNVMEHPGSKHNSPSLVKKEHKAPVFLEDLTHLSGIYQIPQDEVVKINDSVSAIIELYVLFGLPAPQNQRWMKSHRQRKVYELSRIEGTNRSIYKSTHLMLKFVSLNGEGSWVKFLKWKFASLFAFYRNQDIPPKPDYKYPKGKAALWKPDILLGGFCHDFLMNLKRTNKVKFMQFVDSSQQLKKAMPSVPEGMVEKSKVDCRVALTSEPKQLPEDVICVLQSEEIVTIFPDLEFKFDLNWTYKPVIRVTKDLVKRALSRTTRELVDGKAFGKEIFEPFFPSVSGNYVNSRGQCGSLNSLYEHHNFGKKGDCIQFGTHKMRVENEFSQFYGYRGKNDEAWCEHLNSMNKFYDESADLYDNRPHLEVEGIIGDVSGLRETWKQFYIDLYTTSMAERPLVETVGLPEPLKVRVISKGPPLLYTFLKPFQKWLWKLLQSNKVFALIGRYVEESDINRIFHDIPDDYEVVSGDYKASTDNLHSWVSEHILDVMFETIGDEVDQSVLDHFGENFLVNLKTLFRRALTKHIFVEDGVEYPQKEGQLMGSIISFPFLCIANAALCRLSMELANNQTYRLIDKPFHQSGRICPLLVNGDDCVFMGKEGRIRPLWEGICAFAGLESSIGKTYFSKDFCTINSVIFQRDDYNHWVEQKYINLGLMMGKKKVGSGPKGPSGYNSQYGCHQLGSICEELRSSCPPGLWKKVKERFIRYNYKALTQYDLPWFLPVWMGGIGLPIDSPDEVSELDRKIATIIKMNIGSPGYNPVIPKDMPMWLMHKRVLEDSKEFKNVPTVLFKTVIHNDEKFDIEEQHGLLYKYMTINLLMKEDLESLRQDLNHDNSTHKAILRNLKLFQRARKDLILYETNSVEGAKKTAGLIDVDELKAEKKLILQPTVVQDFPSWMTRMLMT